MPTKKDQPLPPIIGRAPEGSTLSGRWATVRPGGADYRPDSAPLKVDKGTDSMSRFRAYQSAKDLMKLAESGGDVAGALDKLGVERPKTTDGTRLRVDTGLGPAGIRFADDFGPRPSSSGFGSASSAGIHAILRATTPGSGGRVRTPGAASLGRVSTKHLPMTSANLAPVLGVEGSLGGVGAAHHRKSRAGGTGAFMDRRRRRRPTSASSSASGGSAGTGLAAAVAAFERTHGTPEHRRPRTGTAGSEYDIFDGYGSADDASAVGSHSSSHDGLGHLPAAAFAKLGDSVAFGGVPSRPGTMEGAHGGLQRTNSNYVFALAKGIFDVPDLGYEPRAVPEPPPHMGVRGDLQRVLRRMPSRDTLRLTRGIDPPRCCVRVRCSGAAATKQCQSCIVYYPRGDGLYCDACFNHRHPSYRVKHVWEHVTFDDTPRSTTSSQLLAEELEKVLPVGGISELIHHARQVRLATKETKYSHDIYDRNVHVKNGLHNADMYHARMRQNMEELRDGKPHSLARKMQGMYRMWKARKTVRRIIRSIYNKQYDAVRKSYYYINNINGGVTWTKPFLLGSDDVYQVPRKRAKDLTRDEAAKMIQNMFKLWKVRQFIKTLIRATWKKTLDKTTGQWYYFNPRSGEVSWEKPRLLGNERMTPRRFKKIKRAKDLKPDEAALLIQGMYRRRHARKVVRAKIRKLYTPITTAEGKTYYVHNETKKTTWKRPRLLAHESECDRCYVCYYGCVCATCVSASYRQRREGAPRTARG